jgi:deoxyribonuclease-4
MLLGAHCSGGIKRGIDRAVEIGAECVQLFAQSPRAWRFPEHDPADLERFRERRAEAKIGAVAFHALYLCNLGTPDRTIYRKSVDTLCRTVDTACAAGAEAVIFHVGSHLGAGFSKAVPRIVRALEKILARCEGDTWLLMENSAGAGGTIGRSLDELATLWERLDRHPRLGVCLDSCHLYASGWDVTDRAVLDGVIEELDSLIGLDRLRALHANDSAAPLGSNRDRHANIGEGLMAEGLATFLGHPKLQHLPVYVETEGAGHGPDEEELRKLRELHALGTRKRRRRARAG